MPWGFQVSEKTLMLGAPVKGSIAAASPELRACVGMILVKINGLPVGSFQDAVILSDESREINMCFRPAGGASDSFSQSHGRSPRCGREEAQCDEEQGSGIDNVTLAHLNMVLN
eukprot:gene13099-biopygen11219